MFIDAVLPLTLRDVERARILFASLERFFTGLGTVWVVVPAAHETQVREALVTGSARGAKIQVLVETELVPEFKLTPGLGGWYKQQLIKLAIAERVASRAYLTLDADVVCTRPVTAALAAPELVPYYVIPQDLHPRWYRRTQAALGMRAVRRGIVHNVTPAVLVRDAVLEIRDFFAKKPLRFDLRGAKQALLLARASLSPNSQSGSPYARWRLMLAGAAPWTEYALYYTYLEATGRIGRYHVETDTPIYDIERSVWQAEGKNFDHWDPAPCFAGNGPPWFVVLQSNTGIEPERVWAKVEPFLRAAPPTQAKFVSG